jgi:hypothetical protein
MKVMLVDWRPSTEPIRAKHKVDRFQYRRFAGVIVTNQEGVIGQKQGGRLNPAKIRYR